MPDSDNENIEPEIHNEETIDNHDNSDGSNEDVISYTGGARQLQNILIDCGSF